MKELQEIFARYCEGKTNAEETAFVNRYYEYFEKNVLFSETLAENERSAIEDEKWQAMTEWINRQQQAPVHRVHFLKTAWFKYAAAILIIATVVGLYYGMFHDSKPGTEVVHNAPPSVPSRDVQPGTDRAVLTLSDGRKVELNDAADETIKDGDLAIGNEDGELRYGADVRAVDPRDPPSAATRPLPPAGDRAVSRNIGFNTMSTPKGGQYKLTLSDGTKVWLNAASSITYPVAFTGKTREVSVTGEAYFEVSKNKEKPFIVTVASSYPPLAEVAPKAPEVDRERSERTRTFPETGGGLRGGAARTTTYRIEVLGTQFNVNSYPDEPSIKTSLIEGSVKVKEKILKPGQAYANDQVTTTNLSKDLAWRNGEFNFEKSTLREAMRQLARWYDIEVEYQPDVPDIKFYGSIKRSVPLSTVLKALQKAGVNFTISDNKKLIVKQ